MEKPRRKKSVHSRRKKEIIEKLDNMKFNVTDDQQIQSKTHIYSRELNQHLLDEISILTNENECLKNQIKENDSQNERHTKVIETLKQEIRNIISAGGHHVSTKSSGIISSKITALCKQNRHLVSELELNKTKYGQLERRLMDMEASYTHMTVERSEEPSVEKEAAIVDQNELRDVKERLAQITRKLAEAKNKNSDLKNELLMANKCLQSEIGPNFTTIQKLIADSTGFRGRAEEIIVLKAKLSELEEKLHGKNKTVDQNKENYNQLIKDIETRRKSLIDKKAKDLELLQVEHNELKMKYDGALARNKILTCEILQLKQTVQGLHDKTLYDEKIKDEMLVKMKDIESRYQGKLAENERIITELKSKLETTTKDLDSEKYRVNALVSRLEEKNEKINYLNEKLDKSVDNSLQRIYYTPLQIAANNEIKTLTDLLNKTNKRLEEERKKASDSEKMYFRAREAKLVMQRKYARMGLELKEKTKKIRSEGSIHSAYNLSIKTSTSTIIHCTDKDCVHFEVERTHNKLELAQEQIKFLEARLKILEDEKATDFETIDEMIFNSKKVFADALKGCKELK